MQGLLEGIWQSGTIDLHQSEWCSAEVGWADICRNNIVVSVLPDGNIRHDTPDSMDPRIQATLVFVSDTLSTDPEVRSYLRTHTKRMFVVSDGWTYKRKVPAWLGNETVTIPDQIAVNQRFYHEVELFPALRGDGEEIKVRLDGQSYCLYTDNVIAG